MHQVTGRREGQPSGLVARRSFYTAEPAAARCRRLSPATRRRAARGRHQGAGPRSRRASPWSARARAVPARPHVDGFDDAVACLLEGRSVELVSSLDAFALELGSEEGKPPLPGSPLWVLTCWLGNKNTDACRRSGSRPLAAQTLGAPVTGDAHAEGAGAPVTGRSTRRWHAAWRCSVSVAPRAAGHRTRVGGFYEPLPPSRRCYITWMRVRRTPLATPLASRPPLVSVLCFHPLQDAGAAGARAGGPPA